MHDYLCIGVVVKPHGVKGELKITHYTDDIRRFAALKQVYFKVGANYQCYQVCSSRFSEPFVFLSLEGINDRNAAERLRNRELFVARQDAVKLPEGRYYIADLIGCTVATNDGQIIGSLTDVLQNAGNDVYVVRGQGQQEVLFPAIKTLFVSIDVENARICVDSKRLSEVAVYEN